MRADSIPQSLQNVLRGFESCLTAPTYRRFLTLVIGWLFCRSRHWVTRVIRASGEATDQHHAGFHRFFSEARWEPDETWQALLHQLLPYLSKRIEV
ncbi:MAG: transposase, partial [bacterium]|nr:transposase [bacterium]